MFKYGAQSHFLQVCTVVDTRQLWIWEAVSPKQSVKSHNLLMLSLGKLSSFTLISTQLPLIFSAGSGPFWQEVGAIKKYCFRFQPSSVKCHNVQMLSLGKLSSFTLISTELPLIFSAESGPVWQEVEALKK